MRDLISILELFNIFDFPNTESKHPISAYEKWSIPLRKFADDFEENKDDLEKSKYYRLRPILHDALVLYDHLRRDFREIHNESGGKAGRMNIVEDKGEKREFEFPFAQLPSHRYRLTKGACYPMLAAFRNMVVLDDSGDAKWRGGFKSVLRLWKEAGPDLVKETVNAIEDIGRTPDHLGKNRKHWDGLHVKLQNRLLRAQLDAARSKRN